MAEILAKLAELGTHSGKSKEGLPVDASPTLARIVYMERMEYSNS